LHIFTERVGMQVRNGYVFTWGLGKEGALGNGKVETGITPSKICTAKFVQIACGSHFTAAVTPGGSVIVWGKNTNGRLGIENGPALVLAPTKLKSSFLKNITQVACGAWHCLALNTEGQVFGWGKNHVGQCQ
jgi:E3 ubiquitin-protein ligase HERC2